MVLPSPDVVVMVDNEAATRATVVEVRAPDGPGVLHKVTAAIAAQGLDIVSASATTLGNAVVDTFYVRADGAKLPVGPRQRSSFAPSRALSSTTRNKTET